MIQLEKKDFLSMPYAIKSNHGSEHKAEVDSTQRTVDLNANTYYWFDTYGDVLVKGCCAKSIKDRGPKSPMPGKIKHLANHDLTKGIGRNDLLEESTFNDITFLHANSWMSETTAGEETLIKYKEGIIDQHSIGFRYLNLEWLESESEAFDEMLKNLINPDDAIDAGWMWVVKEIELYEYSSLDGFGANRLTPFLGVKSDNGNVQFNNLISKLDSLHVAMKSGSGEKDMMNLQEKQINQMIYELCHPEPSEKDMHLRGQAAPSGKDTFDLDSAIKTFNIN